jgi:hypothetical protein
VILQGSFEELEGEEAESARQLFLNRLFPLLTSSTVHTHEHAESSVLEASSPVKPVIYRIRIKEISGRFEKQ